MVGRGRVLRSSLRALVVVAIVISGGLSLGCWGWRLSPVGLTRNRLLSLHGLGGSFFQLASFTVEEGRATDGRGGLFQVAAFDGNLPPKGEQHTADDGGPSEHLEVLEEQLCPLHSAILLAPAVPSGRIDRS